MNDTKLIESIKKCRDDIIKETNLSESERDAAKSLIKYLEAVQDNSLNGLSIKKNNELLADFLKDISVQ